MHAGQVVVQPDAAVPVEKTGLAAPGVERVEQIGCDLQVLYWAVYCAT